MINIRVCQIISILFLITGYVIGTASDLEIFIRNEVTGNQYKLGDLYYDPSTTEAIFKKNKQIQLDDENANYCIGYYTEDRELSCFSYKKLQNPVKGKLVVHTKINNQPLGYSFITANTGANIESKVKGKTATKGKKSHKQNKADQEDDNEDVTVVVSKASIGSKPTLKAPEIKKNKEESKKQIEEENKSFFQKYWMYIVPVAVILLMGGGGAGEQGAK